VNAARGLGVSAGLASDLVAGLASGSAAGLAAGLAAGVTAGLASGFADGLASGFADGLASGLAEGFAAVFVDVGDFADDFGADFAVVLEADLVAVRAGGADATTSAAGAAT
jgi:hypothetical protein